MKKILTLAAGILSASLLLASCTHNANNPSTGGNVPAPNPGPAEEATPTTMFFYGCMTWADGGASISPSWTDDQKTITGYQNNGGGWGGFGLGAINQTGSAFDLSIDMSPVAKVEFDVVSAGNSGSLEVQIGDNKNTKTVINVTNTSQHVSIDVSNGKAAKPGFNGRTNFVIIINALHNFQGEANKVTLSNLKFLDTNDVEITTLNWYPKVDDDD